ncbi:hypothetical protein KAW50_03640 [candidate division WOR-3 bacterium]|nr:hypothetical protein [candidate division WOR-3 bacterium]
MIQEDKLDKALISIATEHGKLVEILKKSLLMGQLGFLKAGETLLTIKSKKTYIGEDLAHEWTWAQFCSRPDLPIPGSTPQSRRRTADSLIRIFKVFIEKLDRMDTDIAPIGWTKLDIIAPLCAKAKTEDEIQDWLGKAADLTVQDLILAVKGKDKEIGDKLDCKHENEVLFWKCPGCGARSSKPMCVKHSHWKIKVIRDEKK